MMRTISTRRWKVGLIVGAALIATASLWVSHLIVRDLKSEERAKMEVWAEAMRALMSADETTDLNLVLKVLNGNHTIPVIVTDAEGVITTFRNLPIAAKDAADSMRAAARCLNDIKADGRQMTMPLNPNAGIDKLEADVLTIHYRESNLLRWLTALPYIQLAVVSLFILVATFALLTSKRAEQNKVWVGLSKETAHQLGTPISSLMAWAAVLRDTYPGDPLLPEMTADIRRLEMIAERFSKVGSAPELVPTPLLPVLESAVAYIRRRTSDRVCITIDSPASGLVLPLSPPLFEWVIEVLCKNAVDAMSGEGCIRLRVKERTRHVVLDLEDTGKGIARRDFATVFKPGFTTKQRGWGLGLSLARRIVEDYHHGRIFVLQSTINMGTTFRIELRRS